ncbi:MULTISPECIES: YcdB/YcdC domain-containing protein [unclassified Gilliamella]|uniref:YcdB/YcdC domain-containing protein n=2 Tax=Gilliamella TaxID=1193503 RepID=UPI0022698E10|nr:MULTISPECIES: YcdB/YcdC domain-containing protein [unclassified Gilliamella]MCX8641516.1 hypothetical protein [Gilliamella sp. B3835]MCX8706731.1 hypothetical protein [Gilliamella sp. B3783]MCX8708589.1 hypothetical protein [Gilliamella sp. B3780]MCX8713880.1 hypothetical protein [Gilliamella sp. B3781]MCX8715665.1 hypothetical protein [Gilliamella sp. B3784]
MIERLIKLTLILSFCYSTCYAQQLHQTKENTMALIELTNISTQAAPNLQQLLDNNELNFKLVLTIEVMHNQQPVTLYRFEPQETMQLHNQHISFLLDNNTGKLEGFVRLLPKYQSSKAQVDKDKALSITLKFLETYAPDLLNNFNNNWIDTHDEQIIVDGKKVTLTGMKVKCRDLNTGLYFWTIIAPDETVMVFERDVEWDFIRAGRQTQKWLHDSWLSKNL